jgi:DNA-binding response OmpR family regulator
MLRADLELAGFEVEEATDGRSAMARLIQTESRAFATIVLDCQTAPYDGQWAITAIRAYHRLDDVPVLLVTDRSGDQARVKAAAGFNVILTRPLVANKVVEAVTRLAS